MRDFHEYKSLDNLLLSAGLPLRDWVRDGITENGNITEQALKIHYLMMAEVDFRMGSYLGRATTGSAWGTGVSNRAIVFSSWRPASQGGDL